MKLFLVKVKLTFADIRNICFPSLITPWMPLFKRQKWYVVVKGCPERTPPSPTDKKQKKQKKSSCKLNMQQTEINFWTQKTKKPLIFLKEFWLTLWTFWLFFPQISLSCRANRAARGTALSALEALKLQPSIKTGAQWRERGEQWRDYFTREFCIEGMKVEDVGYKPEIRWWTDGFLDLEIGIFCNNLYHLRTLRTSIPSSPWHLALTFNCSFLLPSCQSFVDPNAHPCHPIHSCYLPAQHFHLVLWVIIANQQCGRWGQRPSASSTIAASNVFLLMCPGTYMDSAIYLHMWMCGQWGKKSQGEVMVFEKPEPQQ